MPDRGIWTLRCQECQQDFIIEMSSDESLLVLLKTYACPHCKKKPDLSPNARPRTWHEVRGFHGFHLKH